MKQKIAAFFLFLIVQFAALAQQDEYVSQPVFDLNLSGYELKSFDFANKPSKDTLLYYEAENDKGSSARVILNLSTLNREEVTIDWQHYCGATKKSSWVVKLQYRISESGEWIDVKDSRSRNCEFYTGKRASTRNFSKIVLPQECNNRPLVQLSWKLSRVKGRGVAPKIQTRNIKISSLADPYNGVPASVHISRTSDKRNASVEKLNFNHIPLPYTYPETIRLKVEGKCLREDVSFEITGTDKAFFSVDKKSVDARKAPKNITISYAPKKEGVHKAVLKIKTRRLPQEITIPLEGSCAKASDILANHIKNEPLTDKEVTFVAGVFSNKDYQFSMKLPHKSDEPFSEPKADKKTNISLIYKWYRDNVCLMSMKDNVKTSDYCVPLQSPQTANKIEISIENPDEVEISDLYFGFPKAKRMIASGNWDNPDLWLPKGEPNMEDVVFIEDSLKVKVTTDVVCSMLVLGDNVNIDINAGKMFYVSGDIIYGKQSYFSVHQNLLPERWNYISSPVNQARALVYSMRKSGNETWLMKYNTGVVSKHGDNWSEYLVDPNLILSPGVGYAVYTHDALDVKYEGILCNSKTTVALTMKNNDRWNLVGNPFTAPLSTKRLFDDIDTKIQGNAIFLFDRENLVYNPVIVDENEDVMIPSLESFFVETMQDGTEITFKRQHQYIPKSGTGSKVNRNYLSLSANIGSRQQYALLGMIEDAKYGFDEYDAHKMFGISEQMPEIYFIVDSEELSVNTFPDYPAAFDIGLYIGEANRVSLRLDNLSVIPKNVSIILEDKYENKFYDFCVPNNLSFDLESGTTNDRFRIYFNKAINIYEIHSEYSGIYLWSDTNRIMAYSDGVHNLQKVRVYDKNKRLVGEQEFNSNVLVFNQNIEKGRYTVDILVEDVWIKDFIVEVR